MKKIITVAGNGGSGKSTIAKLLAQEFGYKIYVMGDIMRQLASQNNMDIITFQEYLKANPEFDHKVDDMLIKIAKENDEIIIVSRTAWHFVPESYKIYLYVNEEEAGKRIFNDNIRINEMKYTTIEEAKKYAKLRNNLEIERYKKVYNIDVTNKENYNLVLDTSNMTIEEVLERISKEYLKHIKEL